MLERGLSWGLKEDSLQQFKRHLSKNHVAYKALSAGIMIGGGAIGAELLGRCIPFLNTTYAETLIGSHSMIGKVAHYLSEKSFEVVKDLGLEKAVDRLATMCFHSASASHVVRGLGVGLLVAVATIAFFILAIGHVPSAFVYSAVMIAGYAVPLIPGAIISMIGYGLWDMTAACH